MALPASAPKVTCTLSPPLLANGGFGTITAAKLRIDRDLVWGATGETIYDNSVEPTILDTGGLSFEVIPVDADGMLDTAGNLVIHWAYTLTVTIAFSSNVVRNVNYTFQPFTADGTVDLDLVPQDGVASFPAAVVTGSEVTFNITEIPPGGHTAETLAKTSDADGDVQWVLGSVPVILLPAGSTSSDVPSGTPVPAIILVKGS